MIYTPNPTVSGAPKQPPPFSNTAAASPALPARCEPCEASILVRVGLNSFFLADGGAPGKGRQ
ncbi:hypothetical protein AKJ16_DCAP01160 [Drosera capensis]